MSHVETGLPCPHCGGFVVIRRVNLAETRLEAAEATVPADELRQRRHAIAAADGEIGRLEGEVSAANQAVDSARAQMQTAAEAKNRLAQLPPVPAADPGLETAKAQLAAAEARLVMGRALAEAKDIHEKITSNERVLTILAADGLRAQKLARVVDLFNRALAGDAQAAEWAPVTQWRLVAKYLLHYPDHIRPLTREDLISIAEMCEFLRARLESHGAGSRLRLG